MSNTNMTSLTSGTNGTSHFGQFILPSDGSASHSPKSHVSKAKIGGAAEPEDIVRGLPLIFTSRNGAWYHSYLEEIKTNSKSRFCLDAVMKLQLAIDAGNDYESARADAVHAHAREKDGAELATQKRAGVLTRLQTESSKLARRKAVLKATCVAEIAKNRLAPPSDLTLTTLNQAIEDQVPTFEAICGEHGVSYTPPPSGLPQFFGNIGFSVYTLTTGTLFAINLALLTGNFDMARPSLPIFAAMAVFGSGMLFVLGAAMSNIITAIYDSMVAKKPATGPARLTGFWVFAILIGLTLGVVLGHIGLATVDMFGLRQLAIERIHTQASRAGVSSTFDLKIPDLMFYLIGSVITLPSTLYKASTAVKEGYQKRTESWLAHEQDRWLGSTRAALAKAMKLIPILEHYTESEKAMRKEIEDLKQLDADPDIDKHALTEVSARKSDALVAAAQFYAAWVRLIESMDSSGSPASAGASDLTISIMPRQAGWTQRVRDRVEKWMGR
jgi:hypothetical protein